MYLTTSYTGLTFIENLMLESTMQNHNFARYSGHNEGDTYKLYNLLGLDISNHTYSSETELKQFNMPVHVENMLLCKAFLSGENIDELINSEDYNLPFLSKLGLGREYSKKINIVRAVFSAAFVTLLNMARLKIKLSFNELLEQWDEKINPDNVEAFEELKKAHDIANKYFKKNEYKLKKSIIEKAEKFFATEWHVLHDKKNIDKKYNDLKVIIKSLIDIVNEELTETFKNIHQFEKDKLLIQDILISLVTTNKELINLDNYPESEAVKFLRSSVNLSSKLAIDEVVAHHYPKSNQYHSIILFDDASMLVQHTKESDFEMYYNFRAIPQLALELLEENLKSKTKKNPIIYKAFSSKFKDIKLSKEKQLSFGHHTSDSSNYAQLYRILAYYFENENALKSNKFNIIEALKTNIKLEYIEDEMNKIMKTHKATKYAKALFSKKYEHLYSDALVSVFSEFCDLSVPIETLKSYIGKKMASFNTPEELLFALEGTLNLVTNFNAEWVKETTQKVNAKIISEKDNKIIVQLETFEQAKILGSSSWCISRDKDHFENYTKDNRKQYVVYDFTKKPTNHLSMLGCTLSASFKFKNAHWKNDKILSEIKGTDDYRAIQYVINEVKEEKNTFLKKLMRSTSFYFDYYVRTEKTT